MDPLTHRTETTYDAAGRTVSQKDGLNHVTQFSYDAAGRQVKATFFDGTSTSVAYNGVGQKASNTDQAGRVTTYQYDYVGHLSGVILPSVTDPATGNTVNPTYHYSYDNFGNQTLITDPLQRNTAFGYDAQNRQVSHNLPMNQVEGTTYDSFGRVDTHTDFKGQITKYHYDSMGRADVMKFYTSAANYQADVRADTVTYAYDQYNIAGRHDIVTDNQGTTDNLYDVEGRLIAVTSPEGTINYVYDSATGRHTRTWTTNSDTSYGYDELGRLKTVTLTKQNGITLTTPEVTTYGYNAVGNRQSQTLANGDSVAYQYDALNRLTQLTNSQGGTQLDQFTYTLSPTGQRTGVTEKRLEADASTSTTTFTWTYDNLDRLTQEASTSTVAGLGFTDNYTYDLEGNRLQKSHTPVGGTTESITSTYNLNDQLTQQVSNVGGTTTFTYDTNGSLIHTSKTGTSPEDDIYWYDVHNRMVGATISRMESGHTIGLTLTYTYDAGGARVSSTSTQTVDNGTPTTTNKFWLVDSNNPTGYSQVLEESGTAGGTPTLSYTLGQEIIQQKNGTTESFLLADGHGSTRLLTSLSGLITARFGYDAFGGALGFTVGVLNIPATSILYTGQQFDANLLQYYLRARYFVPTTGQFSQRDSYNGDATDPKSFHKYLYGRENPINGSDPTGHDFLGTVSALTIGMSLGSIALPVLGMGYLSAFKGVSWKGVLTELRDPLIWIEAAALVGIGTGVSTLANLAVGKLLLRLGLKMAEKAVPVVGLLQASVGMGCSIHLTWQLVSQKLPGGNANRYVARHVAGTLLSIILSAKLYSMSKKAKMGGEDDAKYWASTPDEQARWDRGQRLVSNDFYETRLKGLNPFEKEDILSGIGFWGRTKQSLLGAWDLVFSYSAWKQYASTNLTPDARFLLGSNYATIIGGLGGIFGVHDEVKNLME